MSVVVVMPSRGRPERAWYAVDEALRLKEDPATEVLLVVDDDDPALDGYLARPGYPNPGYSRLILSGPETGNLVRATNSATDWLLRKRPQFTIVGNLGDDHVVRTPGWDRIIAETLRAPGIAYGDDRLQGERLPTAPFISAEIIRALGWYALPSCRHMYIDDAWKALGQALGVLVYVPEVVIEHVHPATGAVPTDDGYERADASMKADANAYFEWRRTTFVADVENVRAAL